jgi:shikimate kinase
VPHIVLIGFMASGKTAVGRRLARRLGYRFVDTDHLVEQAAGRSVAAIFESDGEAAFRALERETIAGLAPASPTVVATGGGAFVDEQNRRALRRLGPVVWLVTSLETVLERVGRGGAKRPLAQGPQATERLAALLEARMPVYRKADVMVETDGLSVEQAVTRVVAALGPRLRQAGCAGAAHAASEGRGGIAVGEAGNARGPVGEAGGSRGAAAETVVAKGEHAAGQAGTEEEDR